MDRPQLVRIVWTRMVGQGNGATGARRGVLRGPAPDLAGGAGGRQGGAEAAVVRGPPEQDHQGISSSEDEVMLVEDNALTLRALATQRAAEERNVLQQLHGVRSVE